jgi:hypothetical protein
MRDITTLRIAIAFSAPGAKACQVSTAGLRQAVTQPLAAWNLTIVDGRDLEPRAAAAVPEVFVPAATMSLGVPPTFGEQVVATVRDLSAQLAGRIAAANQGGQ